MAPSDIPAEGSRVEMQVEGPAGETQHTGIILPPADTGFVSLKLDNGYNVSHPLSNIISLKLLAEAIPRVESENGGLEFDAALPLIRIIHTGGTIASKVDYSTGAVVARFEPEEMLAAIPELAQIARIEAVKIGNMWSDDMRPQHWNLISQATAQAFEEGAVGVVVTQGTDTMHMTSCALSMAWSGTGGRPPGRIAITGSQRSSDRGSSDAAENLMAAVQWAAHGPQTDGGLGDSVVVVMHAASEDGRCSVHPGSSVRKSHSSRRDAFRSINADVIADIILSREGPRIELRESYSPTDERPVSSTPTKFDTNIRINNLVAGPYLRAELIDAVAKMGGDVIHIQGTGLGHLPIEDPMQDAPENTELKAALNRWSDSGGITLVSSQCIEGPVNMAVYSKGRIQQEMGILGHNSRCGPDAAMIKLHWLLSQYGKDIEKITEAWQDDLVGENPETMSE